MTVSIMLACHDAPVIAADVLLEMGMANFDCSGLDEYDKRNLRRVQGERGGMIKLRGLGRFKTHNDKVQRPSVSEVALEPPVGQDGDGT